VLYRTEDGSARITVRLIQESVWLTLNQIADLFQRDKSVISKHIKNIFETGELDPRPVRDARNRILPPGGDPRRRLPCPLAARHAVPPMRHRPVGAVPGQRLRHGRRTPQAGRRRQLLRRTARPHPRHPFFGARLLEKGPRHLRHERGLRSAHRSLAEVLCSGSEQDALGGTRPYRPRRDDVGIANCKPAAKSP